jgi:hypothetical protein
MDSQVSRRFLGSAGQKHALTQEAIEAALTLSGLGPGPTERRQFALRDPERRRSLTCVWNHRSGRLQLEVLYGRFALVEIPILLGAAGGVEMISRILLVSGAVLVFGVVNWQIVANERNRAAGQPVPLALSPVDPRSLMQGDYTRQILATASPKERGIRVAVLALDNRPVGHFVRFDEIAGLFK